jgi:hypothetical protein
MGFASLYPSPDFSRGAAMAEYRRNFLGGGCYFFTVNLADRRARLLTDHIAALRSAFRDVQHVTPSPSMPP